MPKETVADDLYVPMDVMQPQRIKVLEATIARQSRELAQQAREIARLKRELTKATEAQAARHSVDANRVMWKKTLGRRPKYTEEFLLQVWRAHEAGEPVANIAQRLEADLTMMKTFLKGDYWTEAAKAVYSKLGIA